jgi:hypothetical protein
LNLGFDLSFHFLIVIFRLVIIFFFLATEIRQPQLQSPSISPSPSQPPSHTTENEELFEFGEIIDNEEEIERLIEDNRQQQKELEKELAILIRAFKEYCENSSHIITTDMSKITQLESAVDHNLTTIQKETSKIKGTPKESSVGWNMWNHFTESMKYFMYVLVIVLVFMMTFSLILFKNKR